MIARKPLQIFFAVQKALFLRELGMRFSASKTGLFWTFFEPFMQVFIMVLIKIVIFGRTSDTFDFAVFLALNLTAFTMFKNILMKSIGSFNANNTLFIYKQVKPIDTIIARALVEIYMTGIILCIFLIIGFYFNFDMSIKNLPMVSLGFIWLIFFSLGVGILFAVGNSYYPSIGKITNMLMLFLLFGSAVIFTIEIMPPEIQNFLLLNPITHFMEMIHGYYFHALDDRYVDYGYMLLWTISPLFIGLWLYKYLEEKIISL